MKPHPTWRSHKPPASVRETPATHVEKVAEQDSAAGGRANRILTFADGSTARASLYLKALPRNRRLYAYLRFRHRGRNEDVYVGDATADTRREALRLGWQLAFAKRLIGPRAKRRPSRDE
jgi:DNA mismatch endonuclease (patch repair protein)